MRGRKYTVTRTKTKTRTRQRGRGKAGKKIKNWLVKANKFLKRTKLVSKLGDIYGRSNLPYHQQIGEATKVAKSLGYGLRPAGGMRRMGRMRQMGKMRLRRRAMY